MLIIGGLFGLCVAMLIGLALMTGTSYNDVSVVINIFVEPLLCIIIMVPALLSILKKGHVAKIAFKVFQYTAWGLIAIGVISLLYAGCWLLVQIGQLQDFSFSEAFSYSSGQWAGFVSQALCLSPEGLYSESFIFTYICDNLIYLSGRLGMTYEALNIIIYVVAELLSLGLFYLAYKLKTFKISYFIGGIIFFIVSIVPTLYLLTDIL